MSENGKIQVQTYFAGCDTDNSPELVNVKEGFCYDAYNFRLSSVTGNKNAREKIGGETIEHSTFYYPPDNITGTPKTLEDYICIGAIYVVGYKVVFWARYGYSPIITIDDKIVCETPEIGFTYNHPLQIDKNESCIGGEIFPTDDNVPPLVFSVKDMLDKYAINSDAYFAGFNIGSYEISSGVQNDVPVFVELTSAGISGLLCGTYSYAMRYVDSEGNHTQWSTSTPMIPVPMSYGYSENYVYPSQLNRGGNIADGSSYGIKLKFRVCNFNNYDYVELRRVRFAGIGVVPGSYVPAPETVKIPTKLVYGKVYILEFTDSGLQTWVTSPDDEESMVMSSISKAKAVRYMKNRLVYANVSYSSKDLENSGIVFKTSMSGNICFPFIHDMGRIGHGDAYNQSYYKSYPSGEKYTFGLLCRDAKRETAFVLDITKNYRFPNRRDPADNDTISLSHDKWMGLPSMCNTDNSISKVHEVFAFRDPISLGGKYDYEGYTGMPKSSVSSLNYLISISDFDAIGKSAYYNPLCPKSIEDTSNPEYSRYNVNTRVNSNYGSPSAYHNFEPTQFAPNYYSMGIAFAGITGIPRDIKSFSIVRTKRANSVIAQGIGFYKLGASSGTFGDPNGMTKDQGSIVFYSDDIVNGINQDYLTNNATNLKIQFVSPLGFFSEMFDGENASLITGEDKLIDLALYARLYHTTWKCGLPQLLNNTGADSYDTKFGVWRNDSTYESNFLDGGVVDGNKKFSITAISALTKYSGSKYQDARLDHFYEIDITPNVYSTKYSYKNVGVNNSHSINFDEPVYIINIIDEDAEVIDLNIDSFIDIGHNQKVESIIGISDGSQNQSYELVDERWEDCIPPNYINGFVVPDTDTNCYVYINDTDLNTSRPWLNITNKTSAFIKVVLDDITANGFYASYDGDGTYTNIYGIYTHLWTTTGAEKDKLFQIKFTVPPNDGTVTYTSYDQSLMIPSNGNHIVIKYDSRFPLKVFGGDVFIGESIFCPIDSSNDANGGSGKFKADKGFPYPGHEFNDTYAVVQNSRTTNRYQNGKQIKMDSLRQLVVLFTSESVVNLPMLYNQNLDDCSCSAASSFDMSFPRVNYIQRPHNWDDSDCSENFGDSGLGTKRISDQYKTDFPGEFSQWYWGGFRYSPLLNFDYSQYRTDKSYTNKPTVGFKEQTEYCSGIIWSQERKVNQQDSPGLKSFPATNFYALSDKNGEIKYLFNSTSDKGDNLYAITESGTAILLVEKNTLTDAVGNGLAFFSKAENFIAEEFWLSNDIGMNDQWWRSAAENQDVLYWANNKGVYNLSNNQITDIAREKTYYSKFQSRIASRISDVYATKMCAGINKTHDEYMLDCGNLENGFETIQNVTVNGTTNITLIVGYVIITAISTSSVTVNTIYNEVFTAGTYYYYWNGSGLSNICSLEMFRDVHNNLVFNTELGVWHGEYDYDYEKYIVSAQETWGVRKGVIYKTNSRYTVNGSTVSAKIIGICNEDQPFDKEFISIAIASDKKPTRVNFATSVSLLPECSLYSAMSTPANTYYLKDYGKWTNKIPRKEAGVRDRLQSRYMAFEVVHDMAESMYIVDTVINYKVLKLQY
jgi:hypothetical protein